MCDEMKDLALSMEDGVEKDETIKEALIYLYEWGASLSYFSENYEIKNRHGFDIEELKLNLKAQRIKRRKKRDADKNLDEDPKHLVTWLEYQDMRKHKRERVNQLKKKETMEDKERIRDAVTLFEKKKKEMRGPKRERRKDKGQVYITKRPPSSDDRFRRELEDNEEEISSTESDQMKTVWKRKEKRRKKMESRSRGRASGRYFGRRRKNVLHQAFPLHLMSQMMFFNIYPPERLYDNSSDPMEVNGVDVSIRLEHLSEGFEEIKYKYPSFFKGYHSIGEITNAKEGRNKHISDDDIYYSCSSGWDIYEYFIQDFVCLGYEMPPQCLKEECKPNKEL